MTGTNACGWGAHRKWFQTMASPRKSPVIVYGLWDELRFGSGLRPGRWCMAFWWQSSAAASGWILDRTWICFAPSFTRPSWPSAEFCLHTAPRCEKLHQLQQLKHVFSKRQAGPFWTQRLHHSWRPLGFTGRHSIFPDGGSHTHTRFPTGELNMVNLRYLPKNPIFSWWMYILRCFTIEIAKD